MKLYRGIVVDNADPNKSGRVKVRIFELHGLPSDTEVIDGTPNENLTQTPDDKLPWAEVMQPIDFYGFSKAEKTSVDSFAKSIDGKGSKSGAKTIEYAEKNPGTGYNRIIHIGTWVYCILDNDNPNLPIVIGSLATNTEYTQSKAMRVYDSISGHYEEFNDETGDIIIHNKNSNELILGNDYTGINASQKLNIYSKESTNLHTDDSLNAYTAKDLNATISGSRTDKITGSWSTEAQSATHKTTADTAIEAANINAKAQAQVSIEANALIKIKGSMIMLG